MLCSRPVTIYPMLSKRTRQRISLLTSLLVITSLLISPFHFPPSPFADTTPVAEAAPGTTDVFRGRGAWDGGECFGGCSNPATNALDGSDSTYWIARSNTWRVDVGSAVPVTKIRLYQSGSSYATSVNIQGTKNVSFDRWGIGSAVEPETIRGGVTLVPGWNEITLPYEATYRMYQVVANAYGGGGGWAVYTIQGFADDPLPPPPPNDVFRGQSAWSGNECFAGCAYGAWRATDADEGTSWHANSNIWQVDAGSHMYLTGIEFRQAGNYATTIEVWGSPNDPTGYSYGIPQGLTFYPILTGISVGTGWQYVRLPATGRHRFYQIRASTYAGTGTWQLYTVRGYGFDWLLPDELNGSCEDKPVKQSGCNPVNNATGNFWHIFTDLSVPGRGIPLGFSRTYNSLDAARNGPLGYGWTHNYNVSIEQEPSGNYLVRRGDGSVIRFRSDFSHAPHVFADLSRNPDGTYLLTNTHSLDRLFFTAQGRLERMVDRNGYQTTLSYNPEGMLRTVTDPAGRTLTFTYANGLLTSVRDDAGNRSVGFGYDGNGDLTSATDVGNEQATFTYENHLLRTWTDPKGGVLRNDYDATGRVLRQTDAMNRTLDFEYLILGNGTSSTRITNTLGIPTVEYYGNYMLTRRVVNPGPRQAAWDFGYQRGTIWSSSVVDPNSRVYSSTYDGKGNLLSTTDPLNRTTRFGYNSTNDLMVVTDTVGLATSFSYDTGGNLLSVSRPLTETGQTVRTTYTYDPAKPGDVITVTNPLGKQWGMRYDTYGYPTRSTNPLNEATTFTYDNVGRLLSTTNPKTYPATFAYNVYGEPTILTDTLGYTTTFRYDANGNVETVTDANGRIVNYTYNPSNEVTRVTKPDGTHSDYLYDGLGRVISQTNGLGQPTLYGYDDANRITTVTDALNRSSSTLYDAAGVPIVITDAAGLRTTLVYDNAYQVRSVTYGDGGVTPNVAFDYNSLGFRTVMTDGTGTTLYGYDSLRRPLSVRDGAGRTVSYAYDLASRLTTLTYPNTGSGTRSVTYGYNDANRLLSVRDWLQNSHQFTYDPNGNLTGLTYPNGVQTTVGYNRGDQLTSINTSKRNTTILSHTYGRDPLGLLASANEGSIGSHSYQYDPLYRVTGDNLTGSSPVSSTWEYDGATQITQTYNKPGSSTPITTTRQYDAANQFLSLVEQQGATTLRNLSFQYSLTGNRTRQTDSVSGQTVNYSYDQANRLVNYNNGAATYRYNGDGLRMGKTRSGQAEEQFTWDTVGGLPLLLQDGQASYIYGPGGMVLEQVSNSGTALYYHQDQLGSIRALTDSRGRVTATYNYDAYGNRTSSTGTAYNPFGYAGEYTDSESGLQYLRARYYDPATQQFLSVDPMLASTEQAYAYAGGSPLNFTDPSGLVKGCPWCPDIDSEQIEDDLCNMFGFFCDDTDRAKGAQDFGWDRIAGGAQVCGNAIGTFYADNAEQLAWQAFLASQQGPGVRITTRAPSLKNPGSKFDKAGIKIRDDHFRDRLVKRLPRGVTEEAALRAYNRGRLYYNPKTRNYIRHDPQTKVSVAVDKPSGGEVITVFEGKPSPDWNPVRWRHGGP